MAIKRKILTAAIAGLMSTGLTSCFKDQCTAVLEYTKYQPVYMSYTEFRNQPIKAVEPIELKNPGKIYIKGVKLYVNEAGKGVHVFDNSEPASPKALAFIPIPGNYDIVISGRTMFVDSHVDLLALDISDLNDIKIVSRKTDVFPYEAFVNNTSLDKTKGVVVDWNTEAVAEEVNCKDNRLGLSGSSWNWGGGVMMESDMVTANSTAGSSSGAGGGGRSGEASTGKGGSMARFALDGDKLYTVSTRTLSTFDITNPSNPAFLSTIDLQRGDIETIFPYNQHLFVGSQSGMHIFSVQNNASPVYKSTYQHATACDPVVVENDRAYVTIRTGQTCRGFQNQMDIVDIKDLSKPVLISSHPMSNPHGLGVDKGTMFLCDGAAGLKVIDVTNDRTIKIKQQYPGINAFDVIPFMQQLVMVGTDGIFQYDYSDLNDIRLLSKIPVVK